ncbi:MAG: regulatory protein RecX [Clostridia bacterium]|nr:regulatory protein RecX [Clostridia bacterium]
MEVSRVERIRRRVRLVIGSETILLPLALYRQRPLQPGDEVDFEEYENWLLLRQYRPALDYAVSLLSARNYATGELRARLIRAGYLSATADMVLCKLNSLSLLDDEAFARQWVESRTRRGLGERRIAQEMRQKGIETATADAALDEVDEEAQLEAATRVAASALRRRKPGEDPRKTAQRVIAALARRGYSFDQAREALRRAEASE